MDDEDLDRENDRELDEKRVREYVEQAQSTIESAPQMQEATTKAAVLRDFLDLLNWEIPADTQLEYSVKAFNRTYKVDYALILEGTPVAFLEAKGVDTSLTQKHRKQLQAYLKNEDVNWGILTNAKEYEFYRREVVDSKVQVNSLTSAPLADLPANMTVLRAFTKDAIQSGESEKIATRIHELKDSLRTLDSEKGEIADQITSLLTDRVSETIQPHVESQAKEMIDRLSQDIENEIDTDTDHSVDPEPVDTSEPSVNEQSKSTNHLSNKKGKFDRSGRYSITLLDGISEIIAVSNYNQDEVMIELTNILIKEYSLIPKLEPLPWVPGRTKAIINDTPEWDQADPQYKTLSDGNYLDTKLSKSAKKREIRRMVKKCGLDVKFGGEW